MRPEHDDARRLRLENGRLANLWRAQMLRDRGLSASHRVVCMELVERLDKARSPAVAIVSRKTLAEVLGIAERTVSAAIVAAAKRGHFKIERSTGRGNANVYRPILTGPERDAVSSDFPATERGAVSSDFPEESVQSTTTKCAISDSKGVLFRHPLLIGPEYTPERSSISHRARDVAAPQVGRKRAEAKPFAFADLGKYQRDLANRLPQPRQAMALLSELPEGRLHAWCRKQRNAPETVNLAELATELLAIEGRAG